MLGHVRFLSYSQVQYITVNSAFMNSRTASFYLEIQIYICEDDSWEEHPNK